MARTVSDTNLHTRKARERLKQQREPYWRGIDRGAHIGYRKGSTGGFWVARIRKETQGYAFYSIGKADDIQDADGVSVFDFSQAQQKAREWFSQAMKLEKGVGVAGYTVNDALDDYLEVLKSRKSYKRTVYSVKALIRPALGHIKVADLTAKKISEWHRKLAEDKPRLRSKEGIRYKEIQDEGADYQRRRKNSANRTFTILKAALNLAFQDSKAAGSEAWDRVKPFRDVDRAKIRYLSQDESQRLVNACEGEFKALVQGAILTGARYSELARMRVSDYNRDSGTIHIPETKNGKPRNVIIEAEGQRFFDAITAGKTGEKLIFPKTNAEGQIGIWNSSHQIRPIKAACERAKINPAIGFHILRHTHGSHLAMAGTPMAVIAAQLGHSDTRICERHYAHLSPNYVANTIRANFPNLKIVGESNLVSIGVKKKKDKAPTSRAK